VAIGSAHRREQVLCKFCIHVLAVQPRRSPVALAVEARERGALADRLAERVAAAHERRDPRANAGREGVVRRGARGLAARGRGESEVE
jgi:hypothetical protein